MENKDINLDPCLFHIVQESFVPSLMSICCVYLLCLFVASICWPPRKIENVDVVVEAGNIAVTICWIYGHDHISSFFFNV